MAANIKPWAVSAWLLTGGAVLGGCSSGGSPFNSASGLDRTFIGAAQTWDRDKNGSVSCDEWKQYAATSFREADANGDSMLVEEEFVTMSKSDRLFSVADNGYYDGNRDGKVSLEEMTGKQNRAFALLDKNSDCQIDRTETAQVIHVDKKKDTSTAPSAEDVKRGNGSGY